MNYTLVIFEVSTAVTMKHTVFWHMALCGSCMNRRFGGTYRLHLQGRKIHERRTSVSRWLQCALDTLNKSRFNDSNICYDLSVMGDHPRPSNTKIIFTLF
jgi:hypothetical protein